jgi:hypothetical protein
MTLCLRAVAWAAWRNLYWRLGHCLLLCLANKLWAVFRATVDIASYFITRIFRIFSARVNERVGERESAAMNCQSHGPFNRWVKGRT